MIRSLTVGVCIAAIGLLPIIAQAQEPPPPPPPEYQPPPPQYQPPPPQYQQPPPQYYQQPPPQYYQQPPPRYYQPPRYFVPPPRPPSNGIGAIVVGSIFLGLGLIFVGVSIPFWGAGCGTGHTCFDQPFNGSNDYADASGAVTLDVIGGVMFTLGAVLLPIGIIQNARFNKMRAGQRVQLAPTGLKLTF